MLPTVTDEALEQVEKLVELRECHWDAEYRRHRRPKWYETIAYISRQRRRSEILDHLVALSRTENNI